MEYIQNFLLIAELDKIVVMCNQSMKVYDIKNYTNGLRTECFCQGYPISTYGSHGGLLPNNTPIVCGGSNTKRCFKYEETNFNDYDWKETFSMNSDQMYFIGMTGSPYQNSSHLYYALGSSNKAEVLTKSGWENIGPPLPSPFYKSCLMVINETSILILEGKLPIVGEYPSGRTFIFNTFYNSWVSGPRLLGPRVGAVCGLIRKSKDDDKEILIVAGGQPGMKNGSTEFLNNVGDGWQLGEKIFPKLLHNSLK